MRFVLLFAVIALLAGIAMAEFNITEIRGFDASRFPEYPEIGQMRQNLLLAYYSQGRESLPKDFSEFAQSSLDFMAKFEGAYNLSKSEDPETLLSLPGAIGLAAGSLWKTEEMASDSIPLSMHSAYLARSASERFISTQAERLERLAESEPKTRRKLAYYEAAEGVFKYSGTGVKAAQIRATYESLKAPYLEDMGRADSAFSESKDLCSESIGGAGEWFGIPSYSGLRKCIAGLREARAIYSMHLENEKLAELDRVLSSAEQSEAELFPQVLWAFGIFCAFLVILNVLVLSRIRRWYEDNYDSSLGSEVLRWKGRA